jgi:hypothetical protein
LFFRLASVVSWLFENVLIYEDEELHMFSLFWPLLLLVIDEVDDADDDLQDDDIILSLDSLLSDILRRSVAAAILLVLTGFCKLLSISATVVAMALLDEAPFILLALFIAWNEMGDVDEDETGVGGNCWCCCCINKLGLLNEPPDELDTDDDGDTFELRWACGGKIEGDVDVGVDCGVMSTESVLRLSFRLRSS